MSPRSTRIHSPASSPSQERTLPPASPTFSCTLRASDLTWRFESPQANDHAIEQSRQAAGIDDLDIMALDVVEGSDDQLFEIGKFHWQLRIVDRGDGAEYKR